MYCPEHQDPKTRPFVTHTTGRNLHTCDERCELIRERVYREHPPTLQGIADGLDITRERVRQIIARHGWKKEWGFKRLTCALCGGRYWGTPNLSKHKKSRRHRAASRQHQQAYLDRIRPWDKIALVIALFDAGYKPGEISELAEMHLPGTYRQLRYHGRYEPKGRNVRVGNPTAKVRDRQIAVQYAEGVSVEVICETFDIKPGNLFRIATKQGVKRPDWYTKENNGWNVWRRRMAEMSDKS